LHYPPVISSSAMVVGPRYLSQDEGIVIVDLHRAGLSSRVITQPALGTPCPAHLAAPAYVQDLELRRWWLAATPA